MFSMSNNNSMACNYEKSATTIGISKIMAGNK